MSASDKIVDETVDETDITSSEAEKINRRAWTDVVQKVNTTLQNVKNKKNLQSEKNKTGT